MGTDWLWVREVKGSPQFCFPEVGKAVGRGRWRRGTRGSTPNAFDVPDALRKREVRIWKCERDLGGDGARGQRRTEKFGVAGTQMIF